MNTTLTENDLSLEQLIERHRPRLLAIARRMVRDPDAAQDVVQEAALAALRAWPAFEGRSAAVTWLHRIVVNAALMHLRRGRVRREQTGDTLPPLTANENCPAAAVAQRDEIRRLRACLAQLSAAQRQVIELRDLQGLDTDTCASVLGLSPNAVKIRLHRARRALLALFVGDGGGVVRFPRRARTNAAAPSPTRFAARAAG